MLKRVVSITVSLAALIVLLVMTITVSTPEPALASCTIDGGCSNSHPVYFMELGVDDVNWCNYSYGDHVYAHYGAGGNEDGVNGWWVEPASIPVPPAAVYPTSIGYYYDYQATGACTVQRNPF